MRKLNKPSNAFIPILSSNVSTKIICFNNFILSIARMINYQC